MAILAIDLLRTFEAATVILGGIIIYFALKAYKKSKSSSMLYLAIGFLLVTIGSVAAGILFELLNYDLETVEAVEAGSEVIGFIIIVFSIAVARD